MTDAAKSDSLKMANARAVADAVIDIIERSPMLVADASPLNRDQADGVLPVVDVGLVRQLVKESLLARFPSNRFVRVDPSALDEQLIAWAIVLELLPNRIRDSETVSEGYVSLSAIGRLVARDIGVPRSAMQPPVHLAAEWIEW